MKTMSLRSRADAVTVYSDGARMTRVATVETQDGSWPESVRLTGLPLCLDDASIATRIEAVEDSGAKGVDWPPAHFELPVSTGARVELDVPSPNTNVEAPDDKQILSTQQEAGCLKSQLERVEQQIARLMELQLPRSPVGQNGTPPRVVLVSARLAMMDFQAGRLINLREERWDLRKRLGEVNGELKELKQRASRAKTARRAREEDLCKVAVVTLQSGPGSARGKARIVIEYFVPGARWAPSYTVRFNDAMSRADVAVRGLVCQNTGEDWSNVKLTLSTADPQRWFDLPQLTSLRIGRQQAPERKTGWRELPPGVDELFDEFDHVFRPAFRRKSRKPKPKPKPKLSRPQRIGVTSSGARRLGEILVEWGLVRPNEVDRAMRIGMATGLRIGNVLVDQHMVSESDIAKALAVQYDLEFIDLNQPDAIDRDQLKLLPTDMIRRHQVLPLGKRGRRLVVLIHDPLDTETIDSLRFRMQCEIECAIAPRRQIRQYIDRMLSETKASIDATVRSMTVDTQGRSIDLCSETIDDEEELMLQSIGSGSGLLTLTREADESALGAELLGEICASKGELAGKSKLRRSFVNDFDRSVAAKPLRKSSQPIVSRQWLNYGRLNMPGPGDELRGELRIAGLTTLYTSGLRQRADVRFDVLDTIRHSISRAEEAGGRVPARCDFASSLHGHDYAFSAPVRVDVPSDGQYHAIPLATVSSNARLRYVVVPRESQRVFRFVELDNTLTQALLTGPVDVHVNGEYLMTTHMPATVSGGVARMGLGVEQAIAVARNTTFEEHRCLMSSTIDLNHTIDIELMNHLNRTAHIEVRERVPVALETEKKIDITITAAPHDLAEYEQPEHPIDGGHQWFVQVAAGEKQNLKLGYTIHMPSKCELIEGNRRE